MVSNALSLLFGLIIIAAVVPYLFDKLGGLEDAIEGSCVAKHVRTIPDSFARPYPADGTTWSIGQDWQVGGPFITLSVPGIPATCQNDMPTRFTGPGNPPDHNDWASSIDPDNIYILFDYAPPRGGGINFLGFISPLFDLLPIVVLVGIFGLVATFAFKAFGNRRA